MTGQTVYLQPGDRNVLPFTRCRLTANALRKASKSFEEFTNWFLSPDASTTCEFGCGGPVHTCACVWRKIKLLSERERERERERGNFCMKIYSVLRRRVLPHIMFILTFDGPSITYCLAVPEFGYADVWTSDARQADRGGSLDMELATNATGPVVQVFQRCAVGQPWCLVRAHVSFFLTHFSRCSRLL